MYKTMQDIIDKAKAVENHFFDPGSMEFFSSRLHHEIYGGNLFITSEQDKEGIVWEGDRRWTIRQISENGYIETIGEFGQYPSLADAIAAAKELTR